MLSLGSAKRMLHFFLVAPALLLSLTACRESQDGESLPDGIWAPKYMSTQMLLFSGRLSPSQLATYIDNNKKEHDASFSSSQLASTIAEVSQAFGVDQNVIAGQIQMESTFDRDAVSRTNAVGYMQFTTAGFEECADQLGARENHAHPEAITYFRDRALPLYQSLSGKSWTELHHMKDWRSVFKYDGILNIVCGGILLKSFLAQTRTATPNASMREVYAKSLEDYNGETPAIKAKYRNTVIGWATEMANGTVGPVNGAAPVNTDRETNGNTDSADTSASDGVQFVTPKWGGVVFKSLALEVSTPPETATVQYSVQKEGASEWQKLGTATAPFKKWWDVTAIQNGSYIILAVGYDAAGNRISLRYNKVTVQKK